MPRKPTSGSTGKRGGTPPKEFRYGKGQSGNLSGRPKGTRNLSSVVLEAAEKKISVTIDGRPRRISMRQATVMQLAKKAVSGSDHRAMALFLDRIDEMERRAEEGRPAQFPLSQPDIEVLHAIYARVQLCKPNNQGE